MDADTHQQAAWLLRDALNLAVSWNSQPPGTAARQARANALANLMLDAGQMVEGMISHHDDRAGQNASIEALPAQSGDTHPGLERP